MAHLFLLRSHDLDGRCGAVRGPAEEAGRAVLLRAPPDRPRRQLRLADSDHGDQGGLPGGDQPKGLAHGNREGGPRGNPDGLHAGLREGLLVNFWHPLAS